MTPALRIRAAEPADLEALTALANLPGVRHGTHRLPFTTRAAHERRLGTGHHVVGAIDGDGGAERIVAHGALLPGTGRTAHAGEVVLLVHDDHVGRGHGAAMLAALLDLADDWLGLRRVELTVLADNARAIRLYERHGFEREGTKRAAVLRAGVLVDSHVMGRLRPAPERG